MDQEAKGARPGHEASVLTRLVDLIERNADELTGNWLNKVRSDNGLQTYHRLDDPELVNRAAQTMLTVDGVDKKSKEREIFRSFRGSRGVAGLFGDRGGDLRPSGRCEVVTHRSRDVDHERHVDRLLRRIAVLAEGDR